METVLRQPAAPSDLFAAALSQAADMPHLEDFLGTSCDEIAEPAIRSMLQSDAPRIAIATAVGYWQARQGDVPSRSVLRGDGRFCARRGTEDVVGSPPTIGSGRFCPRIATLPWTGSCRT